MSLGKPAGQGAFLQLPVGKSTNNFLKSIRKSTELPDWLPLSMTCTADASTKQHHPSESDGVLIKHSDVETEYFNKSPAGKTAACNEGSSHKTWQILSFLLQTSHDQALQDMLLDPTLHPLDGLDVTTLQLYR